jgi:DNA-binding ferritin-like protein
MEGAAHVQVLAERCAHYARAIRADLANITDVEDGNTASIYADISRGIENRLRVFDAHLYH